jgi:photosystem II stability/assembly factor-like uncharacterized protein
MRIPAALAATGSALVRVAGSDAEVLLERPGLQCVAVDAARRERIAAGCRGSGLWESEDGGATWRDAELPVPDVFSVAYGPDGALYAGSEPSALHVRRDGDGWRELSALRELPSAPTWSFPPRPWTSHVRSVAPSPHDPAVVLAGIELGGLMRTTDGGETWADHRPGAQRDVHELAWHPSEPGRAYEAGGGGAAWSHDGGDTWEPADEGRDRHYTWALAVEPDDADTWFLSASTGPFAAHGNRPAEALVYRRRGDGPWEELDLGLGRPLDTMPYGLDARDGVVVVALRDGRLLASEDGGDEWRAVEASAPRVVALTLA